MIDYLPEHIHLLISSRTELPFPTIKGVVNHEVHLIGMKQLEFTCEETERLFRHASNGGHPVLSSMQLDTLRNQTEGWVTGLQLAVLTMRTGNGLEGFMDDMKGIRFSYLNICFRKS